MSAGTAIVRRPSPRLAEGIVTHAERTPVDPERALDQWEGYVGALREHGWEVVEAEPAGECPDGVFVEDAAVVPAPEEAGAHVAKLGDGALLMSSAAPRTAELLAARGFRPVLVEIGEFAKLEGCVTCLSIRVR